MHQPIAHMQFPTFHRPHLANYPNLYDIPSCSICLGDLDRRICALPCGHCFHRHCLRDVFPMKCPCCRKPFLLGQEIVLNYESVLRFDDQFWRNILKLEEDLNKLQLSMTEQCKKSLEKEAQFARTVEESKQTERQLRQQIQRLSEEVAQLKSESCQLKLRAKEAEAKILLLESRRGEDKESQTEAEGREVGTSTQEVVNIEVGMNTEEDVKIEAGVNTEMDLAESYGVCDTLGMDRTGAILLMSQKIKRSIENIRGIRMV